MFHKLTWEDRAITAKWLARVIALTVVGGCLGLVAGGLVGLLGGAVYGVVHDGPGLALYVGVWCAQSGLIAGLLTGLFGGVCEGAPIATALPLANYQQDLLSPVIVTAHVHKRRVFPQRRAQRIWIRIPRKKPSR
jgi:hypothetical protein